MASIISAGTTSGTSLNLSADTSGQLELKTGSGPTTAITISSAQLTTIANDATISGLTVGKGGGAVALNTAIGLSALSSNTTGNQQVAIGRIALRDNTTGTENTAVGAGAMPLNISGNYNSALGNGALNANTTGSNNVSVGYTSLAANTTGGNNTAVGFYALQANTTASESTAVGYQSLYSNTTGTENVAVGFQSLRQTTTGNSNTAVGHQAAYSNTTGTTNIAMGRAALYSNTTGANNTALGYYALLSNTTASNNTAVGYQAGYSNTTGVNSVNIGRQAGYSATQNNYNTFVGALSGYTSNITVGGNGYNTCVGFRAGYNLTTGYGNTFIGTNNDTGLGSGDLMTTGNKNTILGGYNGNSGGLDIRTNNNYVVLSDGDGTVLVYTDNQQRTFIGNGTVNDSATLILQGRAASGWGPVIIGRTGTIGSTTDRWFIGSNSWLKGGTTYDTLTCTAGGAAGGVNLTSGATSWTSASDARLKNVTGTYTNALADISQLQPVKFTWKSDTENKPQVGVLAQSVVGVVPEAIDTMRVDKEDETEYLGVRYTELIPLLIASIQELKAEVDSLKAQLNK